MISVEALKEMQRDLDLGNRHLVCLDRDGFAIAHTDDERASDVPLDECDLHHWLRALDEAPMTGLYVVELRSGVWAFDELHA